MTKNTKNAVILSSCVLFFATILILVQFLPNKKDASNQSDTSIINIINEPIDKINNIDIINNYGAYSFIKNSNNKLEITELKKYKKNNNSYNDLTEVVQNITADKLVSTNGLQSAIYGFNSPTAQVIIKGNNINTVLLIGSQAPGDVGYYVAVQNKPNVYLVSNNVIAPFLKSKLDYISLNITSPASKNEVISNLEYIEIVKSNEPEKIKIIKSSLKENKSQNKDEDKIIYKITHPVQQNINKSDNLLIESLENINAQKIECINASLDDLENYNLNSPEMTINLKYKNKNNIVLLISHIENSQDYFVMKQNEDIVYRVTGDNFEFINILPTSSSLEK